MTYELLSVATLSAVRKRLRTKVELARELRQRAARAERLAWRLLWNRRMGEYKFRRQHAVHGFIVDFYCAELQLAIEIDVRLHTDPAQRGYDAARTAALRRRGISVARIPSTDVSEETLRRAIGLTP